MSRKRDVILWFAVIGEDYPTRESAEDRLRRAYVGKKRESKFNHKTALGPDGRWHIMRSEK